MIFSGAWRWTTRRVTDNKFTVRFPRAQLIKDWERFNLVKMRTVKAKIQIDPWNGSIGTRQKFRLTHGMVR
jgi:hypothetical protein